MEWWSDGDYPQKAGDPAGRVPITRVIPIATRYSHLLVRPPGQNVGTGRPHPSKLQHTLSVRFTCFKTPIYFLLLPLCALCLCGEIFLCALSYPFTMRTEQRARPATRSAVPRSWRPIPAPP
jgi:hypothetical protein